VYYSAIWQEATFSTWMCPCCSLENISRILVELSRRVLCHFEFRLCGILRAHSYTSSQNAVLRNSWHTHPAGRETKVVTRDRVFSAYLFAEAQYRSLRLLRLSHTSVCLFPYSLVSEQRQAAPRDAAPCPIPITVLGLGQARELADLRSDRWSDQILGPPRRH
jgi:hypothetical protein